MNQCNLLTERWIPVRDSDGARYQIAPWELPELPKDTGLSISRPDFRAGVMEFLIGLVQTALSPNKKTLKAMKKGEISGANLQKAFSPLEPYFNLFGDRPRFMQDFLLSEKDCKAPSAIQSLLIDSPGSNTIKNNGDFFVKRGGIQHMCPACTAMALITMQNFAPAGGAGIRTSLRGGGPLVTLVQGQGLWDTVCQNIFELYSEQVLPDDLAGTGGLVFPWAVPTKDSDSKGSEFLPVHGHFLHHFWGMPRRIMLLTEEHEKPASCDICQQNSSVTCSSMLTKARGNNYDGAWQHPLTPYFDQGKDKPTLSVKASSNGLAYTNWLGLVYGTTKEGKSEKQFLAARCVQRHLRSRRHSKLMLTAFGYDMDNAKPLQWIEGSFPVYAVTGDLCVFRQEITMRVDAAEKVQKNLITGLKVALYADEGRNANVGKTQLASISRSFWNATERSFFSGAQNAASLVNDESQEDFQAKAQEARTAWKKEICRTAETLFLHHAEAGTFSAEKMQKIYTALSIMRRNNGKATTKALQLM